MCSLCHANGCGDCLLVLRHLEVFPPSRPCLCGQDEEKTVSTKVSQGSRLRGPAGTADQDRTRPRGGPRVQGAEAEVETA